MLRLNVDHVVIRVRDLAAACGDFAALGFTVTPGGEHPALGSRNALIAFDDGMYLELIAFKPRAGDPAADENPSAVMRRIRGWETADEGFVDFALVPSNLAEALAGARERGLSIAGPFPGSRLRPDGQEVAWQFGIPSTPDLPFLCADVTPRALRVPEGTARQHANGVVGIARIVVEALDFDGTARRYAALLGEPLFPDASHPRFAVGEVEIQLEAMHHGNVFIGLRGGMANTALDRARTHNANLVIVS